MDEPARGFRFGALSHRNFRLFFLGQGVSLIGTWMQNVAQGWLVLELTNSPFYVGLVSALGSFGVLLLTIYAGVVADRTNKHRLVILTQSLSMLPAFALAALESDCVRITSRCLLRSEEHTSELQSLRQLVCRLLLEKNKATPHRRANGSQ